MTDKKLEELGINVIRGLAMDAPRKANSGHPGTAMALAPLAHTLFTRVMKYDASEPQWPDRDRFILSVGHASILLYSMLYLTGIELELEDIKEFRQFGSKTPGHPEIHHTPGIDVTTGPLGQGVGNSVGMAVAERYLRAKFSPDLCNHYTYVICGDGDLEEGISHEAASLAGHLGLGRLIAVYDDNHITIDGDTSISFTDDTPKRFEAYGWHVEVVGEIANDCDALEAAINRAKAVEDKPSLIVLRSHIGYPSPAMTDNHKAHGDPFAPEEIVATKEVMGLPGDQDFYVPQEVLDMYREAGLRGQEQRKAWDAAKAASDKKNEFEAALDGRGIDEDWAKELPTWKVGDKAIATRAAIAQVINASLATVPGIISGAADLTGNTGTKLDGEEIKAQTFENPDGKQLYYGIREHGMAAAMVGMAYHGGVLPIGGTFFVFSDYMKPSVRLAALGEAHVIFNWTHDSVGLGEDGPTHQPIEQLAMVRSTPRLNVIRPADANETAHAYRIAVDHNGPTGLILSRQNLPILEGTAEAYDGVSKGGYTLVDTDGTPDVILIGTGSEVWVCVDAAKQLSQSGVKARVVSFPSWNLFEAADVSYQQQVLPNGVPKLSVEAASSFGWAKWADAHVAIDHFGASAPGQTVLNEFGFTPENVAQRAQDLIASKKEA